MCHRCTSGFVYYSSVFNSSIVSILALSQPSHLIRHKKWRKNQQCWVHFFGKAVGKGHLTRLPGRRELGRFEKWCRKWWWLGWWLRWWWWWWWCWWWWVRWCLHPNAQSGTIFSENKIIKHAPLSAVLERFASTNNVKRANIATKRQAASSAACSKQPLYREVWASPGPNTMPNRMPDRTPKFDCQILVECQKKQKMECDAASLRHVPACCVVWI